MSYTMCNAQLHLVTLENLIFWTIEMGKVEGSRGIGVYIYRCLQDSHQEMLLIVVQVVTY